MNNSTEKIKHLEFIENIIERMARNSFMLKGWAITIVTAIMALAIQKSHSAFIIIIIVFLPVILFWFLDAYYLQQERLYRMLYDDVRKRKNADIDFDITASIEKYDSRRVCYCACLFSISEVCFYLSLFFMIILFVFIFIYK